MNKEEKEIIQHKVFISYSWTPKENEKWVIQLSGKLLENGIDVVLDKWDLKAGQDIHAFMERTVNDTTINKVLVICNKEYQTKANDKIGGAGEETLIISPEVYRDYDQNKFIPVVREFDEDKKPCLPHYMKGRLYIDLSNDDEEEFKRLIHEIYDKPFYQKPAIGKPPSYITGIKEKEERSSRSYLIDGILKANNNEYDSAIKDYDEAIRLKPDYAEAYNSRGNAKSAKGDYDGAIKDYDEAIRLKPDYTEAYNNRVSTKDAKGDYDSAIKLQLEKQPKRRTNFYSKIEKGFNKHTFLYSIIITFIGIIIPVLLSQDSNKKIEDTKKKMLVEIDSLLQQSYKDAFGKIMITDYFNSVSSPKLNEGIELSRNEKYQEAINSFTKLIKEDTTFAEAYYHRGIAELKDSSYDVAINDFNKAKENNIPTLNVYFYIGLAHLENNDYEKAIVSYTTLIDSTNNYVEAYYNRGLSYYGNENYSKAITDFKKAMGLKDKSKGINFYLGMSYFYLASYDSSKVYFDKLEKQYPDEALFYNFIGLIYKNREDRDYNKAIEYFTKAITHNKENYVGYLNRGNTYKLLSEIESKKGNTNQANIYLDKAKKDFEKVREIQNK